MSTNAQFVTIPAIARACIGTLSAANTNRDGTGTIVNVLAAGSAGTRIDEVRLTATGTTTAGMLRLYVFDGTTSHLVREVPVDANTASASNPVWQTSVREMGLILQAGSSLRASTHNAEGFKVTAWRWGDA